MFGLRSESQLGYKGRIAYTWATKVGSGVLYGVIVSVGLQRLSVGLHGASVWATKGGSRGHTQAHCPPDKGVGGRGAGGPPTRLHTPSGHAPARTHTRTHAAHTRTRYVHVPTHTTQDITAKHGGAAAAP